MRTFNFDWRWVALAAIVVIIAGAGSLPWPLVALALAGGGGYLLYYGWGRWVRSGGAPSRSRVQYWRGVRYEAGPQRSGPALPRLGDIGPALLPLLLGAVMLLGGAALTLRHLGL